MRRPSYQVRLDATPPSVSLSSALVALLETEAFVFAKTATSDVASVAALQRLGFHLIETQVQLERELASLAAPATADGITIRHARGDDESAVEEIARASFRFTRFHLDPGIDDDIANEIKAQWTRNFFRGKRGDLLVVAEADGKLCGFNQLLVQDSGSTLLIDLIGVADGYRGRGVADAMVRFAAHGAGQATRYRVATQIVNVPSLRLYEGLGFRVAQSQYVLHAHGGAR